LVDYLINNIYIQKNKSNLKKIFLEVAENNIPAIEVYKKKFELLDIKNIIIYFMNKKSINYATAK